MPRVRPSVSLLLTYAVLTGFVIAPFLAVSVPGMGDTLNHLARLHVLASIAGSADLQHFYQVQWAPIPYLAMDAVVPLLTCVMSVYAAGKFFIIACVLMPVAGAASLHYAVHRRASLVPAAAFLVSTNYLLALGFLNYLFSAGCALLLLAGWVATAGWPRWRRAALFAWPVLLLYFGHAFACLAYCLSVAGIEVARAVRARFRPWHGVAADCMAAAAQALPALAFAATLDVSAGYVGRLTTAYGDLPARIVAFCSPMVFQADGVQAAVLLGTSLVAIILIPRLRAAPALWPAALVVGLAACAMPHVLASTWGTDLRLPLFASLLLIGTVSAPALARHTVWRRGAVAILLICVAAKSADCWAALRQVDGQVAETRQVLARMPRGMRLLVANADLLGSERDGMPASTIWHMPLVAVIDRDAFVPYLFNGLTTVHVRPGLRAASTPNGAPISMDQLAEGLTRADVPGVERGDGHGARLYHFGWPQKFDYVLVQRFGADPGLLPANLAPVAAGRDMDLYRIVADKAGTRPEVASSLRSSAP